MEWRTMAMKWRTNTQHNPYPTDINCTPALEGGARGTPPSTLRQLTEFVAGGTLARSGRFARPFNHTSTSLAERIRIMARSQMAAQTRLMATVAVGNELIGNYMYASSTSRTGSAIVDDC
jgi:hypothetical protein